MMDIRARLRAVRAWAKAALTPSPAAWSAATTALLAFWGLLVVTIAINAVFPNFSVEKLGGFVVIFGAFALLTGVILLVLWLIRLLAPGYRAALLLAILPLLLFLLAAWSKGALIAVPVLLLGISLFFGAGTSLLRQRNAITAVYFALGAVLLGASIYALATSQPEQNPAFAQYHLKGTTLALPDPGEPGPYKVDSFTYGSGSDARRPEYAQGARFKTQSVDGSKLDKQWDGFPGWARTQYWGFDAKHMPLQGRVWMPKGNGPFPIAFVIHGNHAMEDFSDPGYAFLGELFASQGIIFVSVDENFLNSSFADLIAPWAMRNGAENQARAWLLLQNVAQWRRWSRDASSPLAGKIDMDRVVLIGHSRGGEAVSTANAFNALDRFPDDATVPFDFHFHLRGIAAIAPVDGQYTPRHRPTPMQDQNFFTIQGSMDGDMTSFMGSAQYSRATFSGKVDAFKANLYVKGANHGQFNTRWGRNDLGDIIGFLLDERPIMDPEAQRQILKVYLGAFLQMTLFDKDGYRPLFEDARNGAAWLPDDFLINNYDDSKTVAIADADDDLDPTTATMPGVRIAGPNLTHWQEDYVELKWAPLATQAVLLAWDSRVHKSGAAYALDFPAPPAMAEGAALVFSATQTDISTLPKDFEPKGKDDTKDGQPLDWSIVVTDASGQSARLPLSHDQLLYPQIKGLTRRAGWLDSEKPSEIVMRRYRFPLADFVRVNAKLDIAQIKQIRFEFDRSKRGAIALDDVGLTSTP
jgi:hypothetical protein